METEEKAKTKKRKSAKKQRIPVSKIYWKKGMYKELVDDPYNLKS